MQYFCFYITILTFANGTCGIFAKPSRSTKSYTTNNDTTNQTSKIQNEELFLFRIPVLFEHAFTLRDACMVIGIIIERERGVQKLCSSGRGGEIVTFNCTRVITEQCLLLMSQSLNFQFMIYQLLVHPPKIKPFLHEQRT